MQKVIVQQYFGNSTGGPWYGPDACTPPRVAETRSRLQGWLKCRPHDMHYGHLPGIDPFCVCTRAARAAVLAQFHTAPHCLSPSTWKRGWTLRLK